MECTMKKLITGILLFVLSMQGVAAQNNPYELDDACYPLFQRAELLVGKEGFDSVNETPKPRRCITLSASGMYRPSSVPVRYSLPRMTLRCFRPWRM